MPSSWTVEWGPVPDLEGPRECMVELPRKLWANEHKTTTDMSTGPFSVTRPDQLIMTIKVEFSKYSIVVSSMLLNACLQDAKHYIHDMHEKYAE